MPGAIAKSDPTMTPAQTPSAVEIAKTTSGIVLTLTPIRIAASRFSATARIAYVCRSGRADPQLVELFCLDHGYRPVLFDATDRIQNFPERAIWPGLMISLVVLAVNYIGDGLRDALDPRIRGR